MMKLCSYIVGGGIAAVSLLFVMSREWGATAICLAGALLLTLPCILKGNENNVGALAAYLLAGVNVMVLIVTLLSGGFLRRGGEAV